MMLSQGDINKIAVIAVVLIKGKKHEELKTLRSELNDPDACKQFTKQLEEAMSEVNFSESKKRAYCDLITKRVLSNIELRLKVPEFA